MDQASKDLRTLHGEQVNMRRFFKTYLPNSIFTPPYKYYADREDEEDGAETYGWQLQLKGIYLTIKLGEVEYMVLDIYRGEHGIWGLSLIAIEAKSWHSIFVSDVTPGWKNYYAYNDDFYQKELDFINQTNQTNDSSEA